MKNVFRRFPPIVAVYSALSDEGCHQYTAPENVVRFFFYFMEVKKFLKDFFYDHQNFIEHELCMKVSFR